MASYNVSSTLKFDQECTIKSLIYDIKVKYKYVVVQTLVYQPCTQGIYMIPTAWYKILITHSNISNIFKFLARYNQLKFVATINIFS